MNVPIPSTYAQWARLFESIENREGDDQLLLNAAKQGCLQWQSGVAERFMRLLSNTINARLRGALERFRTANARALGQERLIILALNALRRETEILFELISLPITPENEKKCIANNLRSRLTTFKKVLKGRHKLIGRGAYLLLCEIARFGAGRKTMSSYDDCIKLLTRYTIARIPFIFIQTIERNRALGLLKEVAQSCHLQFAVHTLSKGTIDIESERSLNPDKTLYGVMEYMSIEMPKRANLTLVLTEIPDISTDSADSRQLLDLVTLANDYSGSIIVLGSQSVWNRLQRLGIALSLDLPDEEEMFRIISQYAEMYRAKIQIEWDHEDIRVAAAMLAGVTRVEAENVMASLVAKQSILKSDLVEMRFTKDRLFTEISGLEKIEVAPMSHTMGGLSGLRKWVEEKKLLLLPSKRDEIRRRGLQPPRGILLVGVPGCGKSLSAKSIADSWKLPLYRLDFATVQGSYVGQSERQLKEALSTAEHVAPCVLWIDEIEKGLAGAGASNDGGVSTRMVGQFLFWLQECKKQVFVVATANDVSLLPSELLRRGRFDELFFVDLPSYEERQEIIALYMKRYLDFTFESELATRVLHITDGFTAADLESSVRELTYRKIANDDLVLSDDLIVQTFNNVIPLSKTSPEKIESIREWGRERAVPASGRPIGVDGPIPKLEEKKVRTVLINNP